MSTKAFFQEITSDIQSLFSSTSKVGISNTKYVPNVEDSGFTLGNGEILNAKTINTCVLFIDIRKSTQLNFKHSNDILARLYASFMRSMLKAADYYKGKVRNINGDRIMVVFDEDNCFINAINMATLMHTISHNIIDKYFTNDEFSCGIGLDYGEMLVVKTGTVKKGDENQFYKSFVWLGKPANLASKLTDIANKKLESEVVDITYIYREFNMLAYLASQRVLPIGLLPGKNASPIYGPPKEKTETISALEFARNIKLNESGSIRYKDTHELVRWQAKLQANTNPPILMTEEVYQGLVTNNLGSSYIKGELIREHPLASVEGYSKKIYGGRPYFPSVNEK